MRKASLDACMAPIVLQLVPRLGIAAPNNDSGAHEGLDLPPPEFLGQSLHNV